MVITSLSNHACLNTTDFQSHGKSNAKIIHINYVQLYKTIHLEMAAHFQKVTETGPPITISYTSSKSNDLANEKSSIFMPPKELWETYSNRTVRPSVRPASCPVHISYILLGRNSKFGVWMHLGMAECHIPFSGHCELTLTSDLVFIVITMSVCLSVRPFRFVSSTYLLYSLR